MKKQTIKIDEYKDIAQGFQVFGEGIPEGKVLDSVLDFTKNKEIKIYKHNTRRIWKENKKYKLVKCGCGVEHSRGDVIYYLDIYYQSNK